MNFYEQELRNLFGSSPMLQDVHYFGRTCLAKLDQDLRVKLQFTSTGYADHYNAIKLAIINRRHYRTAAQTWNDLGYPSNLGR